MKLVQKQQEQLPGTVFTQSHSDLIKDMYFKGSSDQEFMMFLHVCKKTGLDPAMRQIFPVKRWDNKTGKETMTIQTGIDGYRLIAERTGRYAPGREPTYQYDNGKLVSATAYVKKQTQDGTWHEIASTAFYDEYVQTFLDKKTGQKKPTQFWQNMQHNQLAKCAEALALRKAFPGDLSGIYTEDEMMQAKVQESDFVQESTPKIEEKAIEKITSEEAENLRLILQECDPEYVKRVMAGLTQCKPPVHDLKDVPRRMYTLAMERAIDNRKKYQYTPEFDEVEEFEDAVEA